MTGDPQDTERDDRQALNDAIRGKRGETTYVSELPPPDAARGVINRELRRRAGRASEEEEAS